MRAHKAGNRSDILPGKQTQDKINLNTDIQRKREHRFSIELRQQLKNSKWPPLRNVTGALQEAGAQPVPTVEGVCTSTKILEKMGNMPRWEESTGRGSD